MSGCLLSEWLCVVKLFFQIATPPMTVFSLILTKPGTQIGRQLRTQYVEGISRPKYYTMTLKCGFTQGH